VRPKAITATSIAPYLDFGVTVDAELELTIAVELEVVLDPVLLVAVEPLEPLVVLLAEPEPVAVDNVVAAVEFPLLVTLADEVTVALPLDEDEDGDVDDDEDDDDNEDEVEVELWAKTAPDEVELTLEVVEDATSTDEETVEPLQEPEILMLW
jgi:hypothetical protein